MRSNIYLKYFIFYLILFIVVYFFLIDNFQRSILIEYSTILDSYIEKNLKLSFFFFLLLSVIWISSFGLGTPVTFFSGFFFGNFLGLLLSLFSLALGSTIFYIIVSKFLYVKIKDIKIIKKKRNLILKIKKNEFDYFFLFRLIGGLKMPLILQNILPVVMNMRVKTFFISTLLGMGPSTFINVSIGSAFKKLSNVGVQENIINIFTEKEIFIPLFGIILLSTLSYIIKKKYFATES